MDDDFEVFAQEYGINVDSHKVTSRPSFSLKNATSAAASSRFGQRNHASSRFDTHNYGASHVTSVKVEDARSSEGEMIYYDQAEQNLFQDIDDLDRVEGSHNRRSTTQTGLSAILQSQ
jgi:hypothetical protein